MGVCMELIVSDAGFVGVIVCSPPPLPPPLSPPCLLFFLFQLLMLFLLSCSYNARNLE